jgi:hypothetical protein
MVGVNSCAAALVATGSHVGTVASQPAEVARLPAVGQGLRIGEVTTTRVIMQTRVKGEGGQQHFLKCLADEEPFMGCGPWPCSAPMAVWRRQNIPRTTPAEVPLADLSFTPLANVP